MTRNQVKRSLAGAALFALGAVVTAAAFFLWYPTLLVVSVSNNGTSAVAIELSGFAIRQRIAVTPGDTRTSIVVRRDDCSVGVVSSHGCREHYVPAGTVGYARFRVETNGCVPTRIEASRPEVGIVGILIVLVSIFVFYRRTARRSPIEKT
jgi:hypothetical protein